MIVTGIEGKTITVLDWLEEKERIVPNKVAARDVKYDITYSELIHDAKKIASAISVAPRKAVLLYMKKSIPCFSSMIGALYAGCFYSVIDTQLPYSRIQYICEVVRAQIVITDRINEDRARTIFEPMSIRLICYDDIDDSINYDFINERRRGICDADPMYCNFTSGSTGNPKGVLISNRAVIDFIPEFCRVMRFTSEERFANQAPFDFDVSVKDLYSSIYLGAEVSLIPREYFVNPTALMDYLVEKKATVLVWAVSAMIFVSGMKGFRYRVPTEVKKIIFSGEVIPLKHLKIWRDNLPSAMFVNVYGPTEITCNCTYHILDECDFESDDIPIGVPFANERVFLLDENNKEILSPGIEGEICVSGTCLALGYIGTDNAEAFVKNPLNDIYNETIYRTGDKGKYDDAGRLHYKGRLDFQIKHMGHRIELLEIEKQCDKIIGVNRSGCVYEKEKNTSVLYYEGEARESDVFEGLNEVLPYFMRPTVIRHIDKMPISIHGKLDRRKMREL